MVLAQCCRSRVAITDLLNHFFDSCYYQFTQQNGFFVAFAILHSAGCSNNSSNDNNNDNSNNTINGNNQTTVRRRERAEGECLAAFTRPRASLFPGFLCYAYFPISLFAIVVVIVDIVAVVAVIAAAAIVVVELLLLLPAQKRFFFACH